MERKNFYVHSMTNTDSVRECDGEDNSDATQDRERVSRCIIYEHVSNCRGPKGSKPERHHRREYLPVGDVKVSNKRRQPKIGQK